jgi:ATP-binding cassette subfamily B protein
MSTNKHTVKLYWQQIRKYKTSFFLALVSIPLAALLIDTLLPFFFSQTIGGLASHNEHMVWNSLIIATIIGLGGAALNLIGFQALIRHEGSVRTDLSDATFRSLMEKDMRFYVNEKVGALTSRYIDFVRSQVSLQDLLIIRTLGFVLSIGTGLVIVTLQSWPLALIIALLIGGLIWQIKWSVKKRAPWRHERKKLVGEIHGGIADAITNNLVVKTFAGEAREIETISKKNQHFKHLFIKDIGFFAKEGSARVAMMILVQISAVALCAYFVFHGQMAIAIAIFTLTYLQRIASQIFTLGDMLNGYDQALLEAAPLSDILAQKTVVNDRPGALTLHDITPTITFKNTSYKYDDNDTKVLKAINLSIPAGQKVGLIGHSGAGKTTISHLLLRFSDVSEGSIEIDGHDIRDITQTSLREHIAYVPQEPMLFHRTLRDNIAYGKPDATDAEVIQAAKQAHAYEFIKELPQQFDTLVGERGVKLSGGQRQRIAIARAILKDAPILVLDEATSALDSESEKLIQAALEKLMKGRTSIVIAHRLSTIAKLDRIITLDQGSIVEDGNHQELLARGGIYAKLWNHQSGGFIED